MWSIFTPAFIPKRLKLLADYHASGNSGHFTFSQTNDVFTILPTQSRDGSGVEQNIKPILSTPISVEPQEFSTAKAIEILCAKINDAVGQREIGLGTMPVNILQQHTIQLSASNEPARNVLEQILTAAGQGEISRLSRRLVCRLLYGPDVNRYALNFHIAEQGATDPTGRGHRSIPIQ
jgi:hypothetical protein